MSKQKSELKTLLLQIRQDPSVRREEYESFCDYSGLTPEQMDIVNVFDTPDFEFHIADAYDAIFVGGASEASVSEPKKYPFVEHSQDFMLYCLEKDIPVFASCFGFQLAVKAFGGSLVKDTENFEDGTIPISLTENAKNDPVFSGISNPFIGVSFHQESALELPKNCKLLAYTEMCCHAFRIPGKRFWAFQFHPELDKERLIERLTAYCEKYTKDECHLQEIISRFQDATDSHKLVGNFVERVLLQ